MPLTRLIDELTTILDTMEQADPHLDVLIARVSDHYKLSGRNLYRYLLLRNYDLRQYHDQLSELGISALRSAEGYTYSNLFNVIKNLHLLAQKPFNRKPLETFIGYHKSKKLVKKHANLLFNADRKTHFTEIMVTLPSEAAKDRSIIEGMVESGMEIARINLSHDTKKDWLQMVHFIREVEQEFDTKLKIYMDLAGPKIRTSDIQIEEGSNKVKSGIKIRKGEHIILTAEETVGCSSTFGKNGEQLTKAKIGVMLPEIIKDVEINDELFFDDGMIKAKVVAKQPGHIEVVITSTYKAKLSGRKGINLPNTKLNLPALTMTDIANLPFAVEYADIIGYSFVRTDEDVLELYGQLRRLEADHVGVVFKIENKEAFQNLPEILITGMRHSKIGVMIARGDLAVELGFERISEVQNQILWICEAAHVPVIWATQVLDNLARSGIPTRAEVSDAAQAAMAECVMLNKGPYINEAIAVLKNILVRMESHSFKKKSALRVLNVANRSLKRSGLIPEEEE